LKPSRFNIENLMLEIRDEITNLNAEEDFRHILLEDIKLAALCFKEKNILSVLNCLGVLAGELQSQVILSRCHYSVVEKLLTCIHRLQQLLIRLPVSIIGPIGPTGPAGPIGATGPAGNLGSMGPMDPGVNEPTEETAILSGPCPVSRFPIPEKTPVSRFPIPEKTPVSRFPIPEKIPVSCYPILKNTSTKSGFIDYSTHVVFYGNLGKKR
jgi:hypothetical protein